MMPGPDGFDVCRAAEGRRVHRADPDRAGHRAGGHARAACAASRRAPTISCPSRCKREELIARVKTLRRLHDTRKELESRRLAAEVQRKEAIRKAFSRYISPRLADRIARRPASSGDPFQGRAQRTSLVALFADLRGFTRLTERTRRVARGGDAERVLHRAHRGRVRATTARCSAWRATACWSASTCRSRSRTPRSAPGAPRARWWRASARWPRAGRREHGLSTGVGIGIVRGRGDHRQRRLAALHELHHHRRSGEHRGAPDADGGGGRGAACGPLLRARPAPDARRARGTARGDVTLRGKSEPIPVFAVSAGARERA